MSKPLIEDHSPLSKLLGKMPSSYAPMPPPSSSRAPNSLSGPRSSALSLWSLQTHCTRSLFICGVVIWCICRGGWSIYAPTRGSSSQESKGSRGSYQAVTCSVAAQGQDWQRITGARSVDDNARLGRMMKVFKDGLKGLAGDVYTGN
jgi:hypothetical protein